MNVKRLFRMLVTTPNSSAGLIIRAERLEESTTKMSNHDLIESTLLYAEVLRNLAAKGWSSFENRKFIRENLRLDRRRRI